MTQQEIEYMEAFTRYLDANHPGQWSTHHRTYETIVWNADVTPPSKTDFLAGVDAELASFNAASYARSRASEYPAIGDQLDALFHAGVFPEDMAAKIQAVKDKYPKESA